jgi:putative membrane-bound dehydrogenase-like protein
MASQLITNWLVAWTLATLSMVAPSMTPALGQGYLPQEAEKHLTSIAGTRVKLFASEPNVRQATFVKCDDRGRLWTIQYLQYPNPAGLKRVRVDRWSRTVYDRVPEPPPRGPRGADRITILTDADGDGRADSAKDFVDGLNLATGVEFGHGGVYVLQPPYLLFYPDGNRDDVPDSDPEVLLTGFGMEDAQSMANHLTWGPDGWLYGVNGSTTTCNIRGIEFQQGCWRFHPATKEFELFCEGGQNCYGLTFDEHGELFYSTNGGPFVQAVQGGYFYKSFGKHGPLHNLFAYHYFPQQQCDQVPGGPPTGGTIYLGDALPSQLRGCFLAGNFLGHTASWWKLAPVGSGVNATYGGVLFDAHDAWSGPTDFCYGPDGCAYISDFFDQRTAHPDPDANWDRTNGRIYRIEPEVGVTPVNCDIAALSSQELVGLLGHRNRWLSDRARVELAHRRDESVIPQLRKQAIQTDNPQLSLESLWALNVTTKIDEPTVRELLKHPEPYVRYWTVRFLGDRRQVSSNELAGLEQLAQSEDSPNVLGQLAASAKRLPEDACLSLVNILIDRQAAADDARVPWLVWWAIESKAVSAAPQILSSFSSKADWSNVMRRDNGLRLLRRWAADGTPAGYDACLSLFKAVPRQWQQQALVAIRDGLAERSTGLAEITQGGLFNQLAAEQSAAPQHAARTYEPLHGPLRDQLIELWRSDRDDDLKLELALQAEDQEAYAHLTRHFAEPTGSTSARSRQLLRQFGREDVISLLLPKLNHAASDQESADLLDVLARFDDPGITRVLMGEYASLKPARRRLVRDVLLSRDHSALAFLSRIDRDEFPPAEVNIDELRKLALFKSEEINALVHKHWGAVGPGTAEEKLAAMRRFNNDLRAAPGDPVHGKQVFANKCGVCHTLNGEGAKVGPDLTTANRKDLAALLANIVDPSTVIRREYVVNVALTASGRAVTGILAEQNGAAVTLLTAENKRVTLPRDEIAEIEESEVSLMPEGLLDSLAPQDRRDLFSYLQQ